VRAHAIVLVVLAGCSGGASETPGAEHTSSTTNAPSEASATLTPLFCAYGGVGIVPDPLPPGYETMFASAVVQIDNAGPPIAAVTLAGASLVDPAGGVLASLVRLDHLVVLPEIAPTGPTMGSFAVYLNPEGTPFDGALPTGRTILRARFSIDRSPEVFPVRCRLELAGGRAPMVSNGGLDGVWPTS
jgi:hypothetical protein